MTNYTIKNKNISIDEIYDIVFKNKKLSLSKTVISNINKSRSFLEKKIRDENKPFYGVNILVF